LKKISNVLERKNKEEGFDSKDSHKKLLGCINFLGELILKKFIGVGMIRLIAFLLLSRFLVEYEEFKLKATQNKFYEDILDAFIGFLRIARKEIFGKEASKPKTGKEVQVSSCIVTSFQAVLTAINKNIVPVPKLSELEPSFEELIEMYELLLFICLKVIDYKFSRLK